MLSKIIIDDDVLRETNASNAYHRVLKHFSMQGHTEALDVMYLDGAATLSS